MTSQFGKQTIAIDILPNSKVGQVIEYNMKKIVFENSYQKCGGETIPRLNLRISLDQ